jgi:predicted adenylyl cyclase CyaB
MARNVEIKARVRDWQAVAKKAAALAKRGEEVFRQLDTFFPTPTGRLKLRQFYDGTGELIFYRRPDQAGPKTSEFQRVTVRQPEAVEAILAAALEVKGVVRKERHLLKVGRTRIHLDRVEGLGDFLELEVELAEGEPPEAGEAEARRLMDALGVSPEDLVEGAYLDLLSP